MQKKVQIHSSSTGQTIVIQTSAETWAELKQEVVDEGLWNNSLQPVIKYTNPDTGNVEKENISNDSAFLPEGDFKLFLIAAKMKSGSNIPKGKKLKLTERLTIHNQRVARVKTEITELQQEALEIEAELLAMEANDLE